MQPVGVPTALVLTAVLQQLNPVTVPLPILMLAQVFVELCVVAETKTAHYAMFEHPLIDEAIVVEECSDAMKLVVLIDLPVVKPVFDLKSNEVFLQIGTIRGFKPRTVELEE